MTPPTIDLRNDLRVPLASDDLHHKRIGIHGSPRTHREEAGHTAGYEDHALFVFGNGLLPALARHIPENDIGQPISAGFEFGLRVLKVGTVRVVRAAVNLNV